MVVRDKGPSNPVVIELVRSLRQASNANDAPIWRAISKRLQKPRRNRSAVNISRINRYSKDNETLLVPGKVLATGELSHPVNVAALAFSDAARKKITDANGRAMSISELVEENPKGSKVRILG